jgi:hypothetical protein
VPHTASTLTSMRPVHEGTVQRAGLPPHLEEQTFVGVVIAPVRAQQLDDVRQPIVGCARLTGFAIGDDPRAPPFLLQTFGKRSRSPIDAAGHGGR